MAERDEHGRFLPGNKASPGRAPRVTEHEYLDVLIGAVPLDKWRKIVEKAVRDAIIGDFRARQWIGEYIIGKPPTVIDLRAADAALLAQLLKQFEVLGMTASDVFAAMLAQIAEESEHVAEGNDTNGRE